MDYKGDRDSFKIWRVYKVVHEMIRDRGYKIDENLLNISIEDFLTKYGDGYRVNPTQLSFLVNHNTTNESLFIFFTEEYSIGIKSVKAYLEKMAEESVSKAILIIKSSITPSAVRLINSVGPKLIIEQFTESYLMVNVTKHVLVPQHILLTPDEAKEVLSKHMLKESQLPRISVTDPIVRYYGISRGRIIKIIRKSETSGKYITYRLVV